MALVNTNTLKTKPTELLFWLSNPLQHPARSERWESNWSLAVKEANHGENFM